MLKVTAVCHKCKDELDAKEINLIGLVLAEKTENIALLSNPYFNTKNVIIKVCYCDSCLSDLGITRKQYDGPVVAASLAEQLEDLIREIAQDEIQSAIDK